MPDGFARGVEFAARRLRGAPCRRTTRTTIPEHSGVLRLLGLLQPLAYYFSQFFAVRFAPCSPKGLGRDPAIVGCRRRDCRRESALGFAVADSH